MGADYKWSLRGLSGPEREAALRAAHARSADRLQRLCFANGGVYIKLGQHIAQLVRECMHAARMTCACARVASAPPAPVNRNCAAAPCRLLQPVVGRARCSPGSCVCLVTNRMVCSPAQDHLMPEEYVLTMRRTMLNACPASSYAEVARIIAEELGSPPEALFAQFDAVPIASASLAQVQWRPLLISTPLNPLHCRAFSAGMMRVAALRGASRLRSWTHAACKTKGQPHDCAACYRAGASGQGA